MFITCLILLSLHLRSMDKNKKGQSEKNREELSQEELREQVKNEQQKEVEINIFKVWDELFSIISPMASKQDKVEAGDE